MTPRPIIVAIPARDEADRIGACLAALIVQRDRVGCPLPAGSFEVLVLANGCRDGTAAEVRRWAATSPHPIRCIEETLASGSANAGGARRRAMDLAAERLAGCDGLILTTDADSTVAITWVAETLAAFKPGIAAVAGYIDAHPAEIVRLGAAFLQRGRLEDRYLSLVAEIEARCDPRPHDPWPNHRVSSGASLAVTAAAYNQVGGLPALPVGEDAAFTALLDRAGLSVRHAMTVVVSTSCRLDGRAPGGAADTMRDRHAQPEAPCDAGLERARPTLRRAALRGRFRVGWEDGEGLWHLAERLGLPEPELAALAHRAAREPFATVWDWVEARSPVLRRAGLLRPSDLHGEIAAATRLLGRLRSPSRPLAARGVRQAPAALLIDA